MKTPRSCHGSLWMAFAVVSTFYMALLRCHQFRDLPTSLFLFSSYPLNLSTSQPPNLICLLYMALLRCHQFRDLPTSLILLSSYPLNLSTSQPPNLICLLYMALLRCHQFIIPFSVFQVHRDGGDAFFELVMASL